MTHGKGIYKYVTAVFLKIVVQKQRSFFYLLFKLYLECCKKNTKLFMGKGNPMIMESLYKIRACRCVIRRQNP